MKNIKISIIIPVFNVERYVEQCLLSVASQTYDGEIECILIDDCGKDRSMEIVLDFIGKYKGNLKFKVCTHHANRGQSVARNTGIYNASGEYLFFLDSDDQMTSDCLQLLVDKLHDFHYEVVVGDFQCVGEANYRGLDGIEKDVLFQEECFVYFLKDKLYEMPWNKLVCREFLMKNNLYFEEGLLHEDVLWSYLLFSKVNSVGIVKSITYKYIIHSNSIATSISERNIQHLLIILDKICEHVKKNNLLSTFQDIKYYIVTKMLLLISLCLQRKMLNKYIFKIRGKRNIYQYLYFGLTAKQFIKTIAVWLPQPLIKILFNNKIIFK